MDFALLTSGGDCAGMNPAIKSFVERSIQSGHQPWGVEDGLEGLIDGRIRKLSYQDVSGIIYRGGSVLKCSRSHRFHEREYRNRAEAALKDRGIDGLLVLGGEGSFEAIKAFHDETGIRSAGIPATIDNDVPGSSYCLGVDTALNVIRRSIDEIRDTASSFRRIFVIETMGRMCGYLAVVSAIVSGAEVCIVPEIPHDIGALTARLKRDFDAGRSYAIAVVAEAVEGAAAELVERFTEELSIDTRLTVLGHTQRGGSPTVYDRLMAVEFVAQAIAGFESGESAFAVVHQDGAVHRIALSELPDAAEIDGTILNLAERLSR